MKMYLSIEDANKFKIEFVIFELRVFTKQTTKLNSYFCDIVTSNSPHPGADIGNDGWGGRVCVNNGKAIDRGTKCRAGVGMEGGVPPPYVEDN